MAGQVRVEMQSDGVLELLKSDGVKDQLQRRADAIANAAGAADHEATVYDGFDRARATVRTTTVKGARAEAEDRNLSRAVDAGGAV